MRLLWLLASAYASPIFSDIGASTRIQLRRIPIPSQTNEWTKRDILAHVQRRANSVRARFQMELNRDSDKMDKRDMDVQLWNGNQDLEYYFTLSIGTPPQLVNVTVDTGSSDLWVAAPSCTTTNGCFDSITLFDPSKSTTFVYDGVGVNVSYAVGKVSATLGFDTLSVADELKVDQSAILAATYVEDLLVKELPVSGMMGFAWSSLVSSEKTSKNAPYWQNLLGDQKYGFSQPAFSVHLTRAQGERTETSGIGQVDLGGSLVFGGWDDSLLANGVEGIEFVDLVDTSYWLLPVLNVTLNGQPITLAGGSTSGTPENQNAAIDTGTTLIAAPITVADSIYDLIPGATRVTGQNGLWAYPSDANISIGFNFGGAKTWYLSPEDFCYFTFQNHDNPDDTTDYCVGAIFGSSSGRNSTSPDWVIGAAFLKNVYTIFRASPPSVGFSLLATSLNVDASPSSSIHSISSQSGSSLSQTSTNLLGASSTTVNITPTKAATSTDTQGSVEPTSGESLNIQETTSHTLQPTRGLSGSPRSLCRKKLIYESLIALTIMCHLL